MYICIHTIYIAQKLDGENIDGFNAYIAIRQSFPFNIF